MQLSKIQLLCTTWQVSMGVVLSSFPSYSDVDTCVSFLCEVGSGFYRNVL